MERSSWLFFCEQQIHGEVPKGHGTPMLRWAVGGCVGKVLIWGWFPKIGKTPKWMVKTMENPIKMDDLGGKSTIFGNTQIWLLILFCPFPHNHGSVENHPKWKETNIGWIHCPLPWLWKGNVFFVYFTLWKGEIIHESNIPWKDGTSIIPSNMCPMFQ